MDDLISRQAAIDSFRYDDDGTAWNMDDIVYRLEQFPSAQPEREKGSGFESQLGLGCGRALIAAKMMHMHIVQTMRMSQLYCKISSVPTAERI